MTFNVRARRGQAGGPPAARIATGSLVLACSGCAPTVDVMGVYFPGWLVSATAGIVTAYLLVWWLGRRSGATGLAESGVFFVSLTVGSALLLWWVFFRGF